VAWIAWAIFFLVIAGIVVSGSDRTVTPEYRHAVERWLRSEPLYNDTGNGLIYLPHAAAPFAPFAVLPAPLGDVLWRLLTVFAFAAGVRRLATHGGGDSGRELFPLMTALCIPLAADSARNGQATLLVTAMMVLAVADLAPRAAGGAPLCGWRRDWRSSRWSPS
jgi:hypothetical protein